MANKVPLAYADVELQISSAISVGDTSFTLSSANDDDGNALPAGKYCFTVDNGSSNKEYLLGQLNGTNVTSVVSVSRQGVESSGAVRAHRVGAPAILSDFATIQRVADILRGVETLDGASPISYDTEPTLTDRAEIATVGYVLDIVTGGTVAFDNQVITGVNAGETVAAGDLVYFDTADQEWKKTDADTAATVEGVQLAIARGAGTDGAAITGGVQVAGVYTTTGLTAGATYYASNTAGEYTTTAGTTKQAIGYALSTTRLFIIPRNPVNLSTNEKEALAAGGDFGTPSASNKFLTEEYIPDIPSGFVTGVSKKLATNTGTTEIANATTTETNIVSCTIPANVLSTNNVVRVKVFISNLSVIPTGTPDPVFRLKYGSTTVASFTLDAGDQNSLHGFIEANLFAVGSTSSQLGVMHMFTQEQSLSPNRNDTSLDYVNVVSSGTATEDSTTPLTLSLTIQWTESNSSNDFVPAGAIVELIS